LDWVLVSYRIISVSKSKRYTIHADSVGYMYLYVKDNEKIYVPGKYSQTLGARPINEN